MAQFARPTSDIVASPWITAPLWSKIDEGGAGDGTVITNTTPSSSEIFSVQTADVTDPALATGHILRARWAKNSTGGANYVGTLELRQGYVSEVSTGTLIATLTSAAISGTTLQTDTYTLSEGEANSITDYTDLQLRGWAAKSGGGANRTFKVDFVELEVPDLPSVTESFGMLQI